jgi:hypothetical protein
MNLFFNFGQKVQGYDFLVINEQEARASAGIMLVLGLLSLFSVSLTNSLLWVELFSITFIVEFFIRTIINPKYAPYMLLASLIVSNQSPQWVEAKPKQFAWIFGAILAFVMAVFIIMDIVAPVRMLICVICLILLFLESSFGICLGCVVYNKLKIKLQKCPGDICTPKNKSYQTKKSMLLVMFIAFFCGTFYFLKYYKYAPKIEPKQTKKIDKKCTPPQWAINMGHGQMWKKHHCQ